MKVKDKVAIVTGASEGIGLAIAHSLAQAGAIVVLAARSEDKLAEEVRKIPGATAIPTDMRRPEEVRKLIDETYRKFGRVDILINNAGQGLYGPLESIDLEDYKNVMELNVYSVISIMQRVIPLMRQQGGGLILNISSRVSKNYFPNLSAYASTKYALNALSLTARAELAPDNIIVSVMHPKMTATRFGVNAVGGDKRDSRATGQRAPGVDTAEDVAVKVMEQIESEEAEASM